MPESTPKPTRATLPTTRPTPMATTASTTFQATVNHSRIRPRRCSRSLRAGVRTATVSRCLLRAAPATALGAEQPEAVEGDGDGGAHVGKHRQPQRHRPEGGKEYEQVLDEDRDRHVLLDDPFGGAREPHRLS